MADLMQYGFSDFAEARVNQLFNFTRCERPDGTFYGTGGNCRKGNQVGAREKEPSKPREKSASTGGDAGDARKAAAEVIAKYAKAEPATTARMIQLAEANGLKMEGLNYRLKSEDSLARKIESEKAAFGGDARKAADSMSDVNRYTMDVPPGNYGRAVKSVLRSLEKEGFKARIKNYWSPNAGPYRGMNVALTAPDGRKIELQFHTKDSLRVKEKIHKDYEEFRTSKDNERRRQLWERMVRLSKTIPMPKGAMEIGGPDAIKELSLQPA